MNNQKISVKTAAEGIALLLFIGAYKDSEQIVKEIEDSQKISPNQTRFGDIFDEMLHFYLNLADRFSSQYLGEKRNEFFDDLFVQVLKNYIEGQKAAGGNVDEQIFYRIFNEVQKKRQQEYGQYKFITEKDEGMKGNLFWEFESRLAEIFGTKDDSLVIMSIHAILMPNIGKLHEVCKKFMDEVA